LNAQEKAAFAALPREVDPGHPTQDRIVRALKQRGLLDRPGSSRGALWWIRAAAAVLVLFGGGVAVGELHAERRAERRLALAREQDRREAAALVQRTGSEWVAAVAQLGQIPGRDSDQALQGREVAVSALLAAVTELHQVAPNDPFTTRLLEAMAAGRPDYAVRGIQPSARLIRY